MRQIPSIECATSGKPALPELEQGFKTMSRGGICILRGSIAVSCDDQGNKEVDPDAFGPELAPHIIGPLNNIAQQAKWQTVRLGAPESAGEAGLSVSGGTRVHTDDEVSTAGPRSWRLLVPFKGQAVTRFEDHGPQDAWFYLNRSGDYGIGDMMLLRHWGKYAAPRRHSSEPLSEASDRVVKVYDAVQGNVDVVKYT